MGRAVGGREGEVGWEVGDVVGGEEVWGKGVEG